MKKKYYRVKKDTFIWTEGAILESMKPYDNSNQVGFQPIEDVWDTTSHGTEYISGAIIEDPVNAEYFERVYTDDVKGSIFKTASQLKEQIASAFKK